MTATPSSPDGPLAQRLQRLVQALDAGRHALLPGSNDALLSSIVEAAARIFGAGAASILLVNEQEQTLEFRVACGSANRDLVGMSFPLDQGIAGYVAMTGEPIAVSDVQQDTRFNQGFAQSTGYMPRSILAMPLISEGRVIGVMEVLDKIAAASFGLQDMDLLAIFARQAAIAIEQSLRSDRLDQALVLGLRRLAQAQPAVAADAETVLAALHAGDELQPPEILAVADLFAELSSLGAAERKACLQVLTAFAEYSRAQAQSSFM